MGVNSLTGIDGKWLKKDMLISNNFELITHELENPIPVLPEYGLAISLEVNLALEYRYYCSVPLTLRLYSTHNELDENSSVI